MLHVLLKAQLTVYTSLVPRLTMHREAVVKAPEDEPNTGHTHMHSLSIGCGTWFEVAEVSLSASQGWWCRTSAQVQAGLTGSVPVWRSP